MPGQGSNPSHFSGHRVLLTDLRFIQDATISPRIGGGRGGKDEVSSLRGLEKEGKKLHLDSDNSPSRPQVTSESEHFQVPG